MKVLFLKMPLPNNIIIFIFCGFVVNYTTDVFGQLPLGLSSVDVDDNTYLVWCTVNYQENQKCLDFASALADNDVQRKFGTLPFEVKCIQAFSKDECMDYLDENKADLTTVDPGEVFVGGRYHSLIPIMYELYQDSESGYYSVAVIKQNTLPDIYSIKDLRGKKACFPGVGTLAGWVVPIYKLMKHGGMEIMDCNNHIKSAIHFFSNSCAVNSLTDKYNPLGDNSHDLCMICGSELPGEKCTSNDRFAGYEGAFRCLVEKGDVAFLTHTTVDQMIGPNSDMRGIKRSDFQLLCVDGTRQPIDNFRMCNWGLVPSHAVVTSSAKPITMRIKYQKFLQKAAQIFGSPPVRNSSSSFVPSWQQQQNSTSYIPPWQQQNSSFNPTVRTSFFNTNKDDRNFDQSNPNFNRNDENFNRNENFNPNNNQNSNQNWDRDGRRYNSQFNQSQSETFRQLYTTDFHLFESAPKYGNRQNLLFQDNTQSLVPIPENEQTYTGFLGKSVDMIMGVRSCPISTMTMCVVSDAELKKCNKMKTALRAQLLKPEMNCLRGYSQINCMQEIANGGADVAVLDAGDVYTAGNRYGLIPIISEVYNLDVPEFYAVAVASLGDPDSDVTYLKNRMTCHTGIDQGAGWVIPLAYLIASGRMRSYGCDSAKAASQYFTKSCVPGALNAEYHLGAPFDNLCDLCHGTGANYCKRDASEDYYGHTGAFRCLVEGGGQVAFVKHTTVMEVTDGKRSDIWARNTLASDYELLCRDGTRAPVTEFESCNLGRVKANAIVTRNAYNQTELNAFINLFLYAQQYYGRKYEDDFSFSLYYSPPPYSDLIFQDATNKLEVIPREDRSYRAYLGPDFLKARALVDCRAGSPRSISLSKISCIITIFLPLLNLLNNRF